MKKRLFAVVCMTVLLLALVIPVSALGSEAQRFATPAGYDDNDYQKLVSFLEIADGNGVKNGEKLCAALGKEYDPADPSSWQGERYYEEYGWPEPFGVIWAEGAPKRVFEIYCDECGLCGALDVSGCDVLDEISCSFNSITSVDASGCTALWRVECSKNLLTELDLSDSHELVDLVCGYNRLKTLDLSGNTDLMLLTCSANELTSLDLSNKPGLSTVECSMNRLTSLDLSDSPSLFLLYCDGNRLETLNVSQNAALTLINCSSNRLKKLDLSGNPELEHLSCSDNLLTELDVSANSGLTTLQCAGNALTELELTNNSNLFFDRITAETGGTVGYDSIHSDPGNAYSPLLDAAVAEPETGFEFIGWYAEDGSLISEERTLSESGTDERTVSARFAASASASDSPSVPMTGGPSLAFLGTAAIIAGAALLRRRAKRRE